MVWCMKAACKGSARLDLQEGIGRERQRETTKGEKKKRENLCVCNSPVCRETAGQYRGGNTKGEEKKKKKKKGGGKKKS